MRHVTPSPLTCFESNGKGNIARECSNRLRRRKETVTRHKHQYRTSSSSSNNSSADSDSDDSRVRRINHRQSPRLSHHRQGNYQDSRRSPRRGGRSHGHGARQADDVVTVVIHIAVGSMIGRSIRAGMMQRHITIIVRTHDHVTFPPLPCVG